MDPILPPSPAPPAPAEDDPALQAAAAAMLRRIGWEPSHLLQIAVYARMPPEVKVAQMLRLRHALLDGLRQQIHNENPGLSPDELRARVLARLELHRRVQTLRLPPAPEASQG